LLGWDACLKEETPPAILIDELCTHPDPIIIIGRKMWRPEDVDRNRNLFWLHFPMPSYAERKTLWLQFLGQDATSGILNLDDIAGQFSLTTGQIRDIVAAARDAAVQEHRPVENQDIFATARAYSSSGLNKLAKKIKPRYTWADIILPDDQRAMLHELVATVRGRPKVLEEWRVGQKLASSAGVTALFAGPPGTGKTMAAEVIAGELGLDLYKIDLSTVISKYIGETEKNLEKIFQEAESSNAILFFDEADSIFGKRSEVRDSHDRYANIEISYLLQRMEAYDGVTILATNLGANLDEAFTRRLNFSIDFPFPEEKERLRIWQSLFPSAVPRADNLDLTLMARRFKLAGGNIRNVLMSAAYLAAADGGTVTMAHLLHGARRELQKMGRLVNENDMTI
jgi:SpoVK/Ycf46/Vps4 family AAA+-type ATPase